MRSFIRAIATVPFFIACGDSSAPNESKLTRSVEPVPATTAPDGGSASDIERLASPDSKCLGQVAGHRLTVRETLFLYGEVDMALATPVLIVVQADTPGLCAHLQAGTMPKNATLLALPCIQQDGAAVAAPRTYSPPDADDPASTANYFTLPQFRHLDGACAVSPPLEAGTAIEGAMRLTNFEPGVRATGNYDLVIGDGRDVVQGSFDATYCDAPRVFEDVYAFLQPDIDVAHCL